MSLVRNGSVFNHTYDRAASYYMASVAPAEADLSKAKVRMLTLDIYETIAIKSDLLGLKLVEDCPLPTWAPAGSAKEDVKKIRDAFDKIMKIMENLFDFVRMSAPTDRGLYMPKDALKISKLLANTLRLAGITMETKNETILFLEPDVASAWKALAAYCETVAEDSGKNMNYNKAFVLFSRVVYDENKDWLSVNFDDIMNANGELVRLCHLLSERGYIFRSMIDGRQLSLNYVKDFGKKETPLKRAFGERSRLGFELILEDIRITPGVMSLRIPYYGDVLRAVDKFTDCTRAFVMEHTKTCDGCRYCVQTDQSGTRPLMCIEIDGVKKCPLYPAFSYVFTELNSETVDSILQLFDEITEYLTVQKEEERRRGRIIGLLDY